MFGFRGCLSRPFCLYLGTRSTDSDGKLFSFNQIYCMSHRFYKNMYLSFTSEYWEPFSSAVMSPLARLSFYCAPIVHKLSSLLHLYKIMRSSSCYTFDIIGIKDNILLVVHAGSSSTIYINGLFVIQKKIVQL